MTILQWYVKLGADPRDAIDWWWAYHHLIWGIQGRPSSSGPPKVERWH